MLGDNIKQAFNKSISCFYRRLNMTFQNKEKDVSKLSEGLSLQAQYHQLETRHSRQKMHFKSVSNQLDKYYTKLAVARQCYLEFRQILYTSGSQTFNYVFVEPSAGEGIFLDVVDGHKLGFDIAPANQRLDIMKADFLNINVYDFLPQYYARDVAFIGNPPFGTKAQLAIQFINHALKQGKIVGFIVPIQFRRWSGQSKVNSEAKLIADIELPENAFHFMGKDYKLRCSFQVWVHKDDPSFSMFENLRMRKKPSFKHQDFLMYQYNRTDNTKKYFDYEWDFAVPRQGYQDYTQRIFDKTQCNEKQQWIFFKAKDTFILERLLNLDFVKLSRKNIGTPGFGKGDVVQEYLNCYPYS